MRLAWIGRAILCVIGFPLSASATSFDTAPAREALTRLLPKHQAQIQLVALNADDGDRFEVSGTAGHIEVRGTSPAVLLTGVETYLERVPHVSIGWPGNSLDRLPAVLPAPPRLLDRRAVVPDRFALNDVDDGYSDAYLDWPGWEHKLDLLALHGINEVFVPVGTEEVYRRIFRDFGYSDAEISAWIPAAAHQPWWLLQNMSSFGGPMSPSQYERRAVVAQKVVARLRELGMTPVFPGYFGTVPSGFPQKQSSAKVVPQGTWVGFERPGWLDPRGPLFEKLAASFYRHQHELFGDTTLYKMDLLHEGGRAGDVPVDKASQRVMEALQAAHPGARWVMLGWQHNPARTVVEAVDRNQLLVVDGLSDRYNGMDREKDWPDVPYAFGTIPNFGGHTTLGANTRVWVERFAAWRDTPGTHLQGIAYMPEGSGTDPAAFALFTSLAWRSAPVDLDRWWAEYAVSRYGGSDPHAAEAWRILGETAFAMPAGEWSEAQDSLFGARPDLDARSAATWSPTTMRYDAERFEGAVCALLQVSPALRGSTAYRYDLVDVTRQAMSNRARELLPQIKAAYAAKDTQRFHALTSEWMGNMDALDRLLASDSHFLLGRWLMHAKAAARNDTENAQLEYDQRSIVSSWGHRSGADQGGLHDYANREWSGLVGGLYTRRWQRYFASLELAMAGKTSEPIDWFALEQAWARSRDPLPTEPQGDAWELARDAAKRIGICAGVALK